ncbi:MAG: hypothetical protein ACI4Q3_03570 [Kiritimatiellia bacterium]
MTRIACLMSLLAAGMGIAAPLPTELTVQLKLDQQEFVIGERVRAVVSVENASSDVIDARKDTSPDRMSIELYRASDRHQFAKRSSGPFVAPFALLSGEGQKLETFLADHFPFDETTRYLARAVLVHDGTRYESALKSFTVVPGLRIGGALQMFAGHDGLKREFELAHWGRDRVEHLFLKVRDTGTANRRWQTTDVGAFLRVTRPKISILPSGEVVVLHRITQDSFVRTVFWSLPEAFEFHEHEQLLDPDTAGSARVKELYQEAGGVEPVRKAWWKFW